MPLPLKVAARTLQGTRQVHYYHLTHIHFN
jgi:hypothetical protein